MDSEDFLSLLREVISGSIEAADKLAYFFENKRPPLLDNTALEIFKKQASNYLAAEHENNNASATVMLGRMYSEGWGISKDLIIAERYYRKAAENGNSIGQNNLATMYLKGEVVDKDETQAV